MPISGTWYNELGSQLVINYPGGTQFNGSYNTAVGHAEGQYTVIGQIDPNPAAGCGQALGWVVQWINSSGNSNSTTTWSGQYIVSGSAEIIVALWVLTSETPPSEFWAATTVGEDVFFRQQPSSEDVAKKLQTKRPSHPVQRTRPQ